MWQARQPGLAAQDQARPWLAAQLGLAAEAVPLRRDARQRPCLQPPCADHDCGWSHSGGGLLIAIGAGVQLGIDLEWQRPRPNAQALARRYFAAGETRWLASLSPAQRESAFLRLWCAKEAVLKAHGHGLSFGLDRLRFGDVDGTLRLLECDPALGRPQDWTLLELAPAPGYLGALAWRPA
ncbi:4'-phosphopantetheinyl transferase family protein [Lysobacter sp. D1-1-M9]|uniref:4'-phosphopantetheinyl transferase family protein n=1 Tax=Novilysobacter longmucuonensis TaxID=3098603 RepID=UPI002FCC3882